MAIRLFMSRLCSMLMSVIVSVIVLLVLFVTIALDQSGELLGVLCENYQRFYACVMLALAVSAFALWLAPSRLLGVELSVAALATGLLLGLLWERRGS